MLKLLRRIIQSFCILLLRPYIVRELPGWGKVAAFTEYRWNWLWIKASTRTIREKRHGYLIQLDLSTWSDRSYYFLWRWYDFEMQLLINDLCGPGETVVDVGANRGAFALAASHAVNDGKVICFEPNPNCIKSLEHLIQVNDIKNITVYPHGLSDKNENLTLTVPLVNSGEGSFAPSQYEDNLVFSVPVRRGDDILADEKPLLIKIDVEGFETKVILGLSEIIRSCSPIVITEIITTHLKRAGSSVDALKQVMTMLGYRGFRLALIKNYPRRYDWLITDFRNDHFDAVWLNPNVAMHRQIIEQRFRDMLSRDAR